MSEGEERRVEFAHSWLSPGSFDWTVKVLCPFCGRYSQFVFDRLDGEHECCHLDCDARFRRDGLRGEFFGINNH